MTALPTPISNRRPYLARDRRGGARASHSASATLTAAGRLLEATTVDVSRGGARLVSAERPLAGARVSVVFFLHGEIVAAEGTVRWSSPLVRGYYAFGVAFDAIEDDGSALLEGFCRHAVS